MSRCEFVLRSVLFLDTLRIIHLYTLYWEILNSSQEWKGGPFRKLEEKGCFQASHFAQPETWPTIAALTQPGGYYEVNFWQAIQIHHFLGSPINYRRQLTAFELYCEEKEPLPRVFSKIYTLLNTLLGEAVMPSISKWERDLNKTFTPTQRRNIMYLAINSSINTRTQELNYKLLTRCYYTPSRLSKFSAETSDRCWRCRKEEGTLLHIFWSCTKIRKYWLEVQKISQKLTDFLIPNDPAFFLLHCSQIPGQVYKKSVLCHLVNAAKACVTMYWRDTGPPSIAR